MRLLIFFLLYFGLDALTQKARIDNNNNNFVSKGMDKYTVPVYDVL